MSYQKDEKLKHGTKERAVVIDATNQQYTYDGKTLRLNVKVSPLLGRLFLFTLSILLVLVPISGMIVSMLDGEGNLFMSIIAIGLFGIIAHRILRLALWNTYGYEEIVFGETEIQYTADYGWFKDKIKSISANPIKYSIRPIGYEDEYLGLLIIEGADEQINSSVKMPIEEIEEIITQVS